MSLFMFSHRCKTIILLMLLSGCYLTPPSLPTSKQQHLNELFQQCITLTINNTQQLCINSHDSVQGLPITIATFFRVQQNAPIQELTHYINESSAFGEVKFSNNGKYLYIMYADEGHPYFVFYNTSKFIENDPTAQIYQLNEYGISHIEQMNDNGDVIFSSIDCLDNTFHTATKLQVTNNASCQYKLNIFQSIHETK